MSEEMKPGRENSQWKKVFHFFHEDFIELGVTSGAAVNQTERRENHFNITDSSYLNLTIPFVKHTIVSF